MYALLSCHDILLGGQSAKDNAHLLNLPATLMVPRGFWVVKRDMLCLAICFDRSSDLAHVCVYMYTYHMYITYIYMYYIICSTYIHMGMCFLTWPCREVGIRGMNRRYGSGYGSGV